MEPLIPRGMLSTFMAVEWLARCRSPDNPVWRSQHEEAWRDLCNQILEGNLRALVLTEDGVSYGVDRAQFAGLQEQFIFHTETLRYAPNGDIEQILNIPPGDVRTAQGAYVRGRICFFERDLEAMFGAKTSPEESESDPPGNKSLPAKLPKSCPALDRARDVIDELYPNGVPDQSSEENKILCGKVDAKIEEKGLRNVSPDTILRAAGRRK